jgi:cytochrome c-type biogenesis protein CcmE
VQKIVKIRLGYTLLAIASIASGVVLLLYAVSENIVFFYSPSDLVTKEYIGEIRVGGLVKPGSIIKIDSATIRFDITDLKTDIATHYRGVIPALFRENQGVVAEGVFAEGVFMAKKLLTKHDENYRPPQD